MVTIDGLAQATGVTVRNIRAYQARGLLPPPEVQARTGYYGGEHRARLELIKELQGEGLKLDTIRRLFDTTGGSTEHVLTFIRTIRQLFADEPGQIVDQEELSRRYRTDDTSLLKRGLKMGLLRRVADDQFEEVSPRLSETGRALVELGIPVERALDVAGHLKRHADAIAKVYVQVFLDEVWKPFDASGRPEQQWPQVFESLSQLRQVSGEGLLAMLDLCVSERLDVVFGRDITRTVRSSSSDGSAPAEREERSDDS